MKGFVLNTIFCRLYKAVCDHFTSVSCKNHVYRMGHSRCVWLNFYLLRWSKLEKSKFGCSRWHYYKMPIFYCAALNQKVFCVQITPRILSPADLGMGKEQKRKFFRKKRPPNGIMKKKVSKVKTTRWIWFFQSIFSINWVTRKYENIFAQKMHSVTTRVAVFLVKIGK